MLLNCDYFTAGEALGGWGDGGWVICHGSFVMGHLSWVLGGWGDGRFIEKKTTTPWVEGRLSQKEGKTSQLMNIRELWKIKGVS